MSPPSQRVVSIRKSLTQGFFGADREEEMWEFLLSKIGMVVKTHVEVYDRLTTKGNDPILEPLLAANPGTCVCACEHVLGVGLTCPASVQTLSRHMSSRIRQKASLAYYHRKLTSSSIKTKQNTANVSVDG